MKTKPEFLDAVLETSLGIPKKHRVPSLVRVSSISWVDGNLKTLPDGEDCRFSTMDGTRHCALAGDLRQALGLEPGVRS
jgi:hypothetical protein